MLTKDRELDRLCNILSAVDHMINSAVDWTITSAVRWINRSEDKSTFNQQQFSMECLHSHVKQV